MIRSYYAFYPKVFLMRILDSSFLAISDYYCFCAAIGHADEIQSIQKSSSVEILPSNSIGVLIIDFFHYFLAILLGSRHIYPAAVKNPP